MFNLLYKFLTHYDYVSIPGVGQFNVEQQPARLDMDAKVVHAPQPVITFKHDADTADRMFYDFVAREKNIEVVEAIREFQDFSYKLKSNLTAGKTIELPAIGVLQMHNNRVEFKAHNLVHQYQPTIDISNLAYGDILVDEEPNAEDLDENGNARRSYWWVYAIILALIGAGAIIYYYYFLEG